MASRYASRYYSSSEDEEEEVEVAQVENPYNREPVMEPPRIIRKQATEDRDSSDEEKEEEEEEDENSTESRGRQIQQEQEEKAEEEEDESEEDIALDELDVNPEPPKGLNIPTMGRGMSRSMSSQSNVKSQAGMDISDITRKKAEKDLCDLQEMINRHFEQRKQEEIELNNLKERIEKRKEMRAKQLIERQKKEKERQEREKNEKEARERAIREKHEAEEARKKELMASMAMLNTHMDRRRQGKRTTARDAKRKALAERRKPLNIDHLNKEKLMEKCKEMYNWVRQLEEDRYDLTVKAENDKYTLNTLRHRVNDLMISSGKAKHRVGKIKIR
ncbi:Oidioi.mRNA.OKI2018_I69.PAR.g13051.t1.cds [Oikopleura dioica]|uniref:Oidioi.mRNA.OKI2018_I69.PAR.g13051.t1.cds n=1 Tax=Oikopleura dioica TaxID=34765 RepID=A0ABN7S654_OIKDI|nr:Oidioi.mRNA.OKI2018_I69.PAR.g13051.t1.cds [Oikopleura dioica]